jgi:uncharacterized protein YeaO (DUF488 family)
MAEVRTKRVYDPAEPADGYRVLIDRVWPRGVSRERAGVDEWARELAPSAELRKWFGHVPERFPRFRERYLKELAKHAEEVDQLRARASDGPLTIVYGARDPEHNNATVLAELIREGSRRRRPAATHPAGSGSRSSRRPGSRPGG